MSSAAEGPMFGSTPPARIVILYIIAPSEPVLSRPPGID
jgi:hypothetical protein